MSGRIRYTRQNIVNNFFYQLPRFLFDPEFINLSSDAKLLYSILRNRHEMSVKNDWVDENDDVYIYFKREDMQAMLGLSDKPIAKAMKDLKAYGLLEETKQGLGKPNRIYLLTAGAAPHEVAIDDEYAEMG
ncbi:MAG: replication initiator protein A, partial [Eubacterium sp.]|nr:replication initiator protein A [Eubacterium sp.]